MFIHPFLTGPTVLVDRIDRKIILAISRAIKRDRGTIETSSEGIGKEGKKRGLVVSSGKIRFSNRVTFSSSNSRILWMEPPMAFFIKLILTDCRRSLATGSNRGQNSRLTVRNDRRRDHEPRILSFRDEGSSLLFSTPSRCRFNFESFLWNWMKFWSNWIDYYLVINDLFVSNNWCRKFLLVHFHLIYLVLIFREEYFFFF